MCLGFKTGMHHKERIQQNNSIQDHNWTWSRISAKFNWAMGLIGIGNPCLAGGASFGVPQQFRWFVDQYFPSRLFCSRDRFWRFIFILCSLKKNVCSIWHIQAELRKWNVDSTYMYCTTCTNRPTRYEIERTLKIIFPFYFFCLFSTCRKQTNSIRNRTNSEDDIFFSNRTGKARLSLSYINGLLSLWCTQRQNKTKNGKFLTWILYYSKCFPETERYLVDRKSVV